jgi:hypothetical protein
LVKEWGVIKAVICNVASSFTDLTISKSLSWSGQVLVSVVEVALELRHCLIIIQGESLARGPKLLCIQKYIIEIMTWKFIYTYLEWCKTGPHNRCWKWSPFTSKHTWMCFSNSWGPLARESLCIYILDMICLIPWSFLFQRLQRQRQSTHTHVAWILTVLPVFHVTNGRLH